MRAMILAAGHGTRIAPLSSLCAKPALPVLGEAMLARLVRQLAEQGIERAVVNAHAHPDSIREAVRAAPIPVEVREEADLLGSAGGIRAARDLLEGPEPFLVVNGDMALDLDVAGLLARHRAAGATATLALRDDPRKLRFGTIGYDGRSSVTRITDRIDVGGEVADGLFTGVQVLESEIFEEMPDRSPLDTVVDVYPRLLPSRRLAAWPQPLDQAWWPIGTPAELLDANLALLERAVASRSREGDGVLIQGEAKLEGAIEGPAWIGRGVRVPAGARLGPRVVAGEGSEIAPGSTWSDSLLLPGARPRGPAQVERGIAYGEEVWIDG